MRALPHMLLGLVALVSTWVQAQAPYPSRPVHLIIPYAPGGSTDVLGRFMSASLEERWKQPLIVENKPGASATIGNQYAAKAPADGYTLLLSTSSLATGPIFIKNVPYDPFKDFSSISLLSENGYFVLVSSALPVKNFAEFIAYAKANPGKLNYGAGGSETVLTTEDFKARFDLDLTQVMYKGGGPASIAFGSGEVQMIFGGSQDSQRWDAAGKSRTLLYTGRTRHPQLSAVPVGGDLGYPDYDSTYFLSFHGPAGLAVPVIRKVNDDLREFLKEPATVERFKTLGWAASPSSPEELTAAMRNAYVRAKTIAAKVGMKPE